MRLNTYARYVLAALVTFALVANTAATTRTARAKERTQTSSVSSEFVARLARMETALEAKRKELGVPGMALVVVKDDAVVYLKGFGVRDMERALPVTPETLFPIGSSTKAFTSMLAAISTDDGKLSLDDSPKKYLPYFRLQDPEADRRITVRDLMRHNSGLARTEIIWYPGVLDRQEVIRAVAVAKPTAPFGEKFQYQNVMYSAAGEAVARAQNSTWERVVTERLLKPLGMRRSTLSTEEMQKSSDYSLGYQYDPKTKETKRLPFRPASAIASIAPTGALNSSAREMAQWLRLMLGGGAYEGKRLVSEKMFGELVSPQMRNIGGSGVDYGLGWYLVNRKGRKVVQHGGSIDGFRAQVALMPAERLGFVILTNSYHTPLVASDLGGGIAEEVIWSNLIDENRIATGAAEMTGASAADTGREVGKYALAAANLTVEVTMKDGNLVLSVPGQPPYTLESIGGRRYKFADPAPAGYFITFRPAADDKIEMLLEQPPPKRNVTLTKVNPEAESATAESATTGSVEAYGELTGTYETQFEGKKLTFQLTVQDGKLTVLRPGQRALMLVEKSKDTFAIAGAPTSYEIRIKRDAEGRVSGFLSKQPNGDIEFERVAGFKPPLTTEELMTRHVAALGGEAALRKHKTRVMNFDINLVNQGVTGTGTMSAKAPHSTATEMTLTAFGKRLGTIHEYFDGTTGGTESSFLLPETKSDTELAQERIASDFYAPLDWRTRFKKIEITGVMKVGEEEAYIVVKMPEMGAPITDYISTKTHLLLRRDVSSRISRYGDYREVNGVMLPFKWMVETPSTGEQIITVKTVKFDVSIPDSVFGAQPQSNTIKAFVVNR